MKLSRFNQRQPVKYPIRFTSVLYIPIFLGVGLILACGAKVVKSVIEKVVPVVIETVTAEKIPITVTNIGTVEAFSTVDVRSRVMGELTKIHFEEGQIVKKGDLLFTIDQRPYQVALEEAYAGMLRDQAKLKMAKDDEFRYGALVKKDYVSQQQYEQAITNRKALEATVQYDGASVEKARLNLDYCKIYAPIGGKTSNIKIHQGNLINANDVKALITIMQNIPIYVSFSIPEKFLFAARQYYNKTEFPVSVTIPESDNVPIMGQLSFINNDVDQNTGTILLKAIFPNKDRKLWPGSYVDVVLFVSDMLNTPAVPDRAIQIGQEGNFVFVIKEDMTAEMRPVTVGPRYKGKIAIEKGLSPGEKVVTEGQFRLMPGVKVSIEKSSQEGAKDTGKAATKKAAMNKTPKTQEPNKIKK